MRFSMHKHPYVCLSCQIKTGRPFVNSNHFRRTPLSRRAVSSIGPGTSKQTDHDVEHATGADESDSKNIENSPLLAINDASGSSNQSRDNQRHNPPQRSHAAISPGQSSKSFYRPLLTSKNTSGPYPLHTRHASSASSLMLSESQQAELNTAYKLRQKLSHGLRQAPNSKKTAPGADGVPINEALKALSTDEYSASQERLIYRLQKEYFGSTVRDVLNDLDSAMIYRHPSQNKVKNAEAKRILAKLGVVEPESTTTQESLPGQTINSDLKLRGTKASSTPTSQRRPSLASMVVQSKSTSKPQIPQISDADLMPAPSPTKSKRKGNQKSVDSQDLMLAPVHSDQVGELPRLSHDLSRVLFNPGVYQLQDPRSRVYNFSPYLAKPMPASEFNFQALNPYLTSSEDPQLLQLAQSIGSKYIGSSSSMTSVLAHFHFLISQWRELNMANFTRGLTENSNSFTKINKGPAAIFLRYRDGVYAVDADKEFDEPNILMSLGKAMEKLLTLEEADFEKWRRSNVNGGDIPGDQPEMFHYSRQGRFLLRSQLDACDNRLPGTGYFDLKTRAVVGIRQQMRDVDSGKGYQIKERYGTWESYEREYYDMVRSTMLKYSLQVRMGSMDGIFVAYHNISRIFGFQYIPISEMDFALHGQEDTCLGDQEFRFSLNFLEEIFNAATAKFPQQSLRIYFETRDPTVVDPTPRMEVFIEPMSEEHIKQIQASQKVHFDEFEKKMLRGDEAEAMQIIEEGLEEEVAEQAVDGAESTEEANAPLPANTFQAKIQGAATTAADKDFLDKILGTRAAKEPVPSGDKLLALRLTVQNKINDRNVVRPESIGPNARWTIDYSLEEAFSGETAGAMYRACKNRRKNTLTSSLNRNNQVGYLQKVVALSEKGAKWREQQDELDAQRQTVQLYETPRLDRE